MSEIGRVTDTIKLGMLSCIITDFQSEQLDYDRSGDGTHDLKHRSMLTLPLRHRSLSPWFIMKLMFELSKELFSTAPNCS